MKVVPKCILLLALILGSEVTGNMRSRRSVGQFREMISTTSNLTMTQINGYGRYCGFRGSGIPIDNIDRCCALHDQCLKISNRKYCLPVFYLSFFIVRYNWAYIGETNLLMCPTTNSRCQRGVCNCDIQAAACIATHQTEYNSAFYKVFK